MRFGIQTGPQHITWQELVDVWQTADAVGFDTAWTFDHFFPIMSDPTGPQFEGWIALTALAMKTEHVRVGTLVTGITYRNPAVLANMGASLDVITGGRLEMGIGAAWFELEHAALGIDFPTTAERIYRLDESCQIIKLLWTQKVTNFEGRFYQLRNAYCEPKPVQKPHPPIMIGGGGEKAAEQRIEEHIRGREEDADEGRQPHHPVAAGALRPRGDRAVRARGNSRGSRKGRCLDKTRRRGQAQSPDVGAARRRRDELHASVRAPA